MRPPVLRFKRRVDKSEVAIVGTLNVGSLVPVDGTARVQVWVPLGDFSITAKIFPNAAVAREQVRQRISDWYALQHILEPFEEIEIQVEGEVA